MRKLTIVVPDDKMALVEKDQGIYTMEIVAKDKGLLMLCVSSKAGDPFYSCLKYEVK